MRFPIVGCIALGLACGACSQVLGLDGLVADRDGGSGTGCASTCGTPGCGACPSGGAISVTAPGGDFRIDAYEASVEDYAAWLATNPSTAGQGPRCEWNDSFVPGVLSQAARDAAAATGTPIDETACGGYLDRQTPLDQNKAMACVDWCDAVAYCKWTNGHLCGRIGGGTIDITDNGSQANDPTVSEWHRACSDAGTKLYPYGNTYMSGTCNDGNGHVEDVGTHPGCEGGYSGIFDMSGNVNEWEDACANHGNPPAEENCLRRGGAYYGPLEELACAAPGPQLAGTLLSMPSNGNGFRCCR